MSSKLIDTIIIVLDENFGIPRFLEEDVNTLVGIDVMSKATKTIEDLKKVGIRSILLVPEALSSKILEDLKKFVTSVDDVIAFDRTLENTLAILSKRCSLNPQQSIFVAADRVLRGRAASKGYATLPHLGVAAISIGGDPLHFVRVRGDRKRFAHLQQMIPYYFERSQNGNWVLLAVMSAAAVSQAIIYRLDIEILPLDISKEDPLFVQLDRTDQSTSKSLRDQKVLFSDGNKMLLAMGPSVTNDSIPFHDKHGHFNSLMLDLTLLNSLRENEPSKAEGILSVWPTQKAKITSVSIDRFLLEEVESHVKEPGSESFHADV